MGVQIFIHFDNPTLLYRPGQLITGNVSLNTDRQVVATGGLTLSFHGEGEVYFHETRTETVRPPPLDTHSHHNNHHAHHGITAAHNHRHPHNHHHDHHHGHHGHHPEQTVRHVKQEYRNQETYLNNFFTVPLDENGAGVAVELPAGFYRNVPFSFQLPFGIPTSGKLKYGSVKYEVEATLKIKQSILVFTTEVSKSARKEFNILGSLDLALVHGALSPTQLQVQKQFGFLCCASGGELTLDLRLARTGFVGGEPIVFQLNYENSTDVTIKKLEAYLTQKIEFVTFGKTKDEEHKLNAVVHTSDILPSTNGTWNSQLRIPAIVHLTDFGGSRIILVKYTLTVKASASFGRNAKIVVPITVGTMSEDGSHRVGFQ